MDERERFFYGTMMREGLGFDQISVFWGLIKRKLRIKQLKVIIRHELTAEQMSSLGKEFLQGASIEEVQEKVHEMIQKSEKRLFFTDEELKIIKRSRKKVKKR